MGSYHIQEARIEKIPTVKNILFAEILENVGVALGINKTGPVLLALGADHVTEFRCK